MENFLLYRARQLAMAITNPGGIVTKCFKDNDGLGDGDYWQVYLTYPDDRIGDVVCWFDTPVKFYGEY